MLGQCGKKINQYQASCVPLDLFENAGDPGCPYEGFGMVVVLVDVLANCGDQLLNIPEDAVAEPVPGASRSWKPGQLIETGDSRIKI